MPAIRSRQKAFVAASLPRQNGGVKPPLRLACGDVTPASLLHAAVAPPAQEFHKAQVPQHLQLLADLVAHVPVFGMQLLQLRGMSAPG